MARSPLKRASSLKAPFLKQISFDRAKAEGSTDYPFSVPLFQKNFTLKFQKPVTIFVGENGTGKSTLLEFIAYAAGFNVWGGSRNHTHDAHEDQSLEYLKDLSKAATLAWLPKVSKGFFMRAETFFNFLEHVHYNIDFHPECYGGDLFKRSHGESFLSFFSHQMNRQGLFLFDEPESALSPSRQVDFLKLLKTVEASQNAQVIMITHSTLLMSFPGAEVFSFTHRGIERIEPDQTVHFQLMEQFFKNPHRFLQEMMEEEI